MTSPVNTPKMKKCYILIAILLLPAALMAGIERNRGYGETFIFYEGGVEFAIFPDGQFDFFFSPRYDSYQSFRINPRSDFRFNMGRNYDRYVQYDDYGAVIQIAHVPVFYDHYGRIIQAGSVPIDYNFFGQVERIGNLILHYDQFQRLVGYSGFINVRNARYIPRPWHQYYTRPHAHSAIVFHQPYRQYYYVDRMDYDRYVHHYNSYDGDFRRSYFRPGEKIISYHRGRRTASETEIRSERRTSSEPEFSNIRSNQNTRRSSGADYRNDQWGQQDESRTRNVRRERTDSNRSRDSHQDIFRDSRPVTPTPSFPQTQAGRGEDRSVRTSGDSVRQPQAVSSRSRSSRGRE